MEETYRVIVSWDIDNFNKLFYEIRKAINEVHSQHLNEEGIRINMPKYLIELIQRSPALHFSKPLNYDYEEQELRIFGYPVSYSFENLIVVFHEDMPIYGNTSYQVIDLKKIK